MSFNCYGEKSLIATKKRDHLNNDCPITQIIKVGKNTKLIFELDLDDAEKINMIKEKVSQFFKDKSQKVLFVNGVKIHKVHSIKKRKKRK